MRRLFAVGLLSVLLSVLAQHSFAQYYSWGSDSPLKWSVIRTPDVRMIYPDTIGGLARRTLFYIQAAKPDIGYGYRRGAMRIPFVMHPENFQSNGLVMYMPKRVEFLTTPAVRSYSMPWYKQLVAHEYRHVVQYNNLNRGVVRFLNYILGQQGPTVGLLCMPMWAMEGDAVLSETMMSSFGRGLQPSFSMGYRAIGEVGASRRGRRNPRNVDRWFCGSYRDYIPDHYELGYQICSYAYARYGENIWDKVAWYGARNPYVIATTRVALNKYYKTNVGKLFRETFDCLERHWETLPQVEEHSRDVVALPERNHTTYQWPLPLGDTAVLALKSDLDDVSRFVRIDRRTGEEQELCHTGLVSSRPSVGGGRVWWTEYRRSKLFDQRVNSQLCRMDLDGGRPRTVGRKRCVLYPTAAGERFGWIEYAPGGTYTLYEECNGEKRWHVALPARVEVHGLAWDDLTLAWYLLITDDSGMWIARADVEGLHPVTRGAYISLSDLRAENGRLYYGSIASGKDEAHCYDLTTRREYRLSTSKYGAFAPVATKDDLLMTSYDRRGYRVVWQPLDVADSLCEEVTPERLPQNRVNPSRPRWEVVNLDTVRFDSAESAVQCSRYPRRRYRKMASLVNVHSWAPVGFNPFEAVDEHNLNLNLGLTLLSQNLLSNTEAYASYGWTRDEGSLLNLGIRYFGLGVHLDLDFSYGGNQLFYALAGHDKEGNPVVQDHPAPDKYHSVGLSATLPLYYQRGYHTRQLSFTAGWNYSNGMVARLDRIIWDGEAIANMQQIGFRKGLHKLALGAGFSDQVRMAHRDFAPRWGYMLRAMYTFNPANRDFSDLVSVYGQAYLPGFAPHNSFLVAASFQTSVGGYRFPAGYAPLNYKSSRLIPRGFTTADVVSSSYTSAAVNYQLPVWYPEGGISSVLYIKRLRLNVGGDFAQFRRPRGSGMEWRRIWSVGGDVILDFNLFRQPASATSTFKLSCYHPSSGGVYVAASVGLPF